MIEQLQQTIDGLQAEIQIHAQAWLDHKKQTLKQEVEKNLDEQANSVIAKLLGFENRWGRGWEVDHCNGRNGNSAAGDYIRSKMQEGLGIWLDKQVKKLPQLPAGVTKAMKKEYLQCLEAEVRQAVRAKAKKDAEELVKHYSIISMPPKEGDRRIELKI